MKSCKKKYTLITLAIFLISLIISSSCFALPKTEFKPFTPIDMSAGPNHYGGYNYIFSDFPETFVDKQIKTNDARYTISRPAPGGRDYVVEYYHFNKTKIPMRIGVAVINKSDSECTVTVNNMAQDKVLCGSGSGVKMPAEVQKNYQSSSNNFTLAVPGVKSNIPGCSVAMEQDFPDNSLAYGKVKIYIPTDTDLEIRVFFNKEGSSDSNISTCTECDPGGDIQRTAGMFSSDSRVITFDTNVKPKTFYLGFVNDHYNPNEYETSSPPVRARAVVEGNYGITYDIFFTNLEESQVNTIRITPQWKHIGNYLLSDYQEYVIFDGYRWRIVHIDGGRSKDILIPYNGELKFILPGSGCGNICFDLIKK